MRPQPLSAHLHRPAGRGFCQRAFRRQIAGPSGSGALRARILGVDRYNGYNRAPCRLQYCHAHLLREVQDLGKEFPEVSEVLRFVARLAP
ncbi:MAG TPA: transposase, partial [Verrucomicrobiae bacterium]|nr:transposase [Verrucomicrobiae bacterium]